MLPELIGIYILADGYCLDAAVNGTALIKSVRTFADLEVSLTFKFRSGLFQGEGTLLDRLSEARRGDTQDTSTGLPFNDVLEEPLESALDAFYCLLCRGPRHFTVRAQVIEHDGNSLFQLRHWSHIVQIVTASITRKIYRQKKRVSL